MIRLLTNLLGPQPHIFIVQRRRVGDDKALLWVAEAKPRTTTKGTTTNIINIIKSKSCAHIQCKYDNNRVGAEEQEGDDKEYLNCGKVGLQLYYKMLKR